MKLNNLFYDLLIDLQLPEFYAEILNLILVSVLIIVAVIAIPVISWPGNTFKFVKHALEWDYFLGVITFYLLTYFMWKKKIN